MSENQITRQQLYDEIWTNSAAQAARRLGISFAALADVCRRYEIPRPGNGYWHGIRLGRTPTKNPLPPAPSGCPELVVIPQPTKREHSVPLAPPPSSNKSAFAESDIPKSAKAAISLRNTHPLVSSTWEYFRAHARTDAQGRLEPTDRFKCLDLTVSKEHACRALLVFNAIIRTCAKHGWKTYKPERSYYQRNPETIVIVGEQEVRIAMIECSTRREPTAAEVKAADESPYARRSFFTTSGMLRVGIGMMRFESSDVIEESADNPLEHRLSEVVDGLLKKAVWQHEQHLRMEEQDRVREEEEKIRLQSQREREEELKRQRVLEQLAGKWHMSEQIRTFVNECERSLGVTAIQNPAFDRWLIWARSVADKVDPLKNGLVLDMSGVVQKA